MTQPTPRSLCCDAPIILGRCPTCDPITDLITGSRSL